MHLLMFLKIFKNIRDFILKRTFFYNLYISLVGGQKYRKIFVNQHICPKDGNKILDIGCGPAVLLKYIEQDVEYFGFDENNHYIEAAVKEFGHRASFVRSSIESFQTKENYYDIVIANGVLHHIPDKVALQLFDIAFKSIKKEGKLITIDGCFLDNQPIIDKFLLNNDRGKFIRTMEQYKFLAEKVFTDIKITIRSDMLRVPYTFIIMECTI